MTLTYRLFLHNWPEEILPEVKKPASGSLCTPLVASVPRAEQRDVEHAYQLTTTAEVLMSPGRLLPSVWLWWEGRVATPCNSGLMGHTIKSWPQVANRSPSDQDEEFH